VRVRKIHLAWALVALALVVRIGFVRHFWTHPHPASILDSDGYTILAASVVERGEYALDKGIPSLDRPPLFPLFIAFFYLLVGVKPLIVLWLNTVLSTATCGMAYLLGRRLFSERAGLLALAFWAVYPYSIYYCGWAIRECFISLLVAIMLWCLLDWLEEPTFKRGAACGVVGGLIALTNPVALIFLGGAPFVFGLLIKRFRDAWKSVAVYFVVLGVLYSPWIIRNQITFGVPIVTNIHGGKQFFQGMLVPAEAFGTPEETRILETDPDYAHGTELMNAHKWVEANKWFNQSAWKWLFAHPLKYASIVAHRVIKLWRLVPYERVYSHDYRKIWWASALSDGLVIPLGLMGIVALRERWRELLPLYSLLAFWTTAYVLVFVVMRFRMPAMMAMILFAAAFIDKTLFSGRREPLHG